jgi:small RNA 2'-O-methyltransferase
MTGRGQHDHEGESTSLHEERLDVVVQLLVDSGASEVLDLGCGSGALLRRLLARPEFERIVGIDTSLEALTAAERLCGYEPGTARLSLRHGSFTTVDEELRGFAAAAMVETIEHVDPAHLSRVERAVFAEMRPRLVVMTTPNREYNELFGLRRGELRHPDHRFEWDRGRFTSWATGVGKRNRYSVEIDSIGPANRWLGGPTQMAIFRIAGD